ncbi:MAG: transposase [Firmicutes bacterium]|nr:transposase [Bacillota bacterium]
MSTSTRRQWTAEEKLKILEEARQTGQRISEVCRRYGIAIGQFYAWEKQARQGSLEALRNGKRGRKKKSLEAKFQAEIERLRAVITELSVENLALKKGLWP